MSQVDKNSRTNNKLSSTSLSFIAQLVPEDCQYKKTMPQLISLGSILWVQGEIVTKVDKCAQGKNALGHV